MGWPLAKGEGRSSLRPGAIAPGLAEGGKSGPLAECPDNLGTLLVQPEVEHLGFAYGPHRGTNFLDGIMN